MQIFLQKNVTKNNKLLHNNKKKTIFAPNILRRTLSKSTISSGIKLKNHTIMKRIEFIAPVAAMRGNLSGNQTLVYPSKDNRAFDAPKDKRNYARNYTPRFIGAKRASDGHTYFSTKTKSATSTGNNSMLAMAAMGAANAYYSALLKDLPKRNRLEQLYATYPAGTFKSLREFVYTRGLYWTIRDKQLEFVINGAPGSTVQPLALENPFNGDATTDGIPANYPADILLKFWPQLGYLQDGGEPIIFTIDGLTGVCFDEESFDDIITSASNILGLTIANGKVKLGEKWVVTLDGYAVKDTDQVLANSNTFTTTTTEPA